MFAQFVSPVAAIVSLILGIDFLRKQDAGGMLLFHPSSDQKPDRRTVSIHIRILHIRQKRWHQQVRYSHSDTMISQLPCAGVISYARNLIRKPRPSPG